MNSEPQAVSYRADPAILEIAEWLADPVEAADFPMAILRFRNSRWDGSVGLDSLSDDRWIDHFARFTPLPDNLPRPLALRYHGHQFRTYNPDIGDGRGFLFAQIRDGRDRLMDLGTKGSGQTPYSRFGDGRLTLKGAVREILATEMLEALGVHTSKTFSVIETGDELVRNDEPSPTRSAVMVRLSHGHIRIGSFQRLAALGEQEHLRQLVAYSLTNYPGPPPPEDATGRDDPAVRLTHLVVERLADLAASYVAASFVHGVLNTDNMNISGESFDYGPWRFLPRWDAGFTAAYFDHAGLYAFGRQAEAMYWNCGQLAVALRPICDAPPLVEALNRFGDCYLAAVRRRFAWRLGLGELDPASGDVLVTALEKAMVELGAEDRSGGAMTPDMVFHAARTGKLPDGEAASTLARLIEEAGGAQAVHEYWHDDHPQSMLIEEVESIWDAIDKADDWSPLARKITALRRMGSAHGTAPIPSAQI